MNEEMDVLGRRVFHRDCTDVAGTVVGFGDGSLTVDFDVCGTTLRLTVPGSCVSPCAM